MRGPRKDRDGEVQEGSLYCYTVPGKALKLLSISIRGRVQFWARMNVIVDIKHAFLSSILSVLSPAKSLIACVCIITLLKVAKYRVNFRCIFGARGTVSIPEKRVDGISPVDVPPAACVGARPIFQLVPVSASSILIEAALSRMILTGVAWCVIRTTHDFLPQGVEAVHIVRPWPTQGVAISELQE